MGVSNFRDRLEQAALSLANPLAFALRSGVRFSRAGYRERREAPLLDERARDAVARHHLLPIVDRCSEWTLASVLHALDLLEQVFARFPPPRRERLRVLDVGAKNAELAPGILASLRAYVTEPSRVDLTAVELDAHRVYANLHSRADAARYFLGLCGEVGFSGAHRYLARDILDHDERHDVVTWFLPFLTAPPLLRWGLSRHHLKPEAMLRHVIERLEPDGILVIVNQEPEEDARQRELLAKVGARAMSFTIKSEFPRKHHACFVHVATAARRTWE